MISNFFVAGLFALLPVFAFAEAIPRGGPNDSRVRLATYQEGQVYRLNVSLTHVTGPVAVWFRSFDSILCSKGDELWAREERMNSARMQCELH